MDPQLHPTSADYIYEQLRRQLYRKELAPGQRLPEIALGKTFDVSRTPVREALRRLAAEGLVEFLPNVGARVISPTLEEIEDCFDIRTDLECLAICRAAKNITNLQLFLLEEAIEEEREVFPTRNLEQYIAKNSKFHKIIAESSGSPILAGYVFNIIERSHVYMILFEDFFDITTNPSLIEHVEILEALKAGNSDACTRLMRTHVNFSRVGIKESLRQ